MNLGYGRIDGVINQRAIYYIIDGKRLPIFLNQDAKIP